jgi:hypothetical protein
MHTPKKNPGMTTANMKLVILDVAQNDKLESPDQDLQDDEVIVRRVVEVKKLYGVLKGKLCCTRRLCGVLTKFRSHHGSISRKEYEKKVRIFIKYLPLPLIGV